MLFIVIALVAASALWFFFKPDAANRAEEAYQGLRGHYKIRRDKRELAGKLKDWVSRADADRRDELYDGVLEATEGLSTWLGALPAHEAEEFTQKVARFCASLNFDLAWLTDAQVARDPALKKTVEDAVLLYCVAAWRASRVQGDVRGFLAYQAWLAHPWLHKKFGLRLHSSLILRGLISIAPELNLASDEARLAAATASIKRVAEEKPEAFREVLRHLTASAEAGVGPVARPAESPAQKPAEPPAHAAIITPPPAEAEAEAKPTEDAPAAEAQVH